MFRDNGVSKRFIYCKKKFTKCFLEEQARSEFFGFSKIYNLKRKPHVDKRRNTYIFLSQE